MTSRWLQVVLGTLIAALVAVIVIALLAGSNDDKVSLTPGEPQIVSASQLEGFADGADHAVYWVGEIDDTEFELTETDNGRVFVRYVPSGTAAGTGGEYLTVASYPLEDAPAALEKIARRQGDEIATQRRWRRDPARHRIAQQHPHGLPGERPDRGLQPGGTAKRCAYPKTAFSRFPEPQFGCCSRSARITADAGSDSTVWVPTGPFGFNPGQ